MPEIQLTDWKFGTLMLQSSAHYSPYTDEVHFQINEIDTFLFIHIFLFFVLHACNKVQHN